MARAPKKYKKQPEELRIAAEEQIKDATKLVKFDVRDYDIEQLVNKYNSGEYYVPEYQREFTWKAAKKSKFIESVLIGLPIPFVFFWQDEEGKFEIVDGSQRIRTLKEFVENEHKLGKLDILFHLKGFRFDDLSASRKRKFKSRSIRGILLDNDTSASTRTEMFSRINTGGLHANEAEIRRGALPGGVTDLVTVMAENDDFIRLTPMSAQQVRLREREELVVRFFAYISSYDADHETRMFPAYKDRPRDFIYAYLKKANNEAAERPELLGELRDEFLKMLSFVERIYPNGFMKPSRIRQIPRARYEAIAIGSALALRMNPELENDEVDISGWMDTDPFVEATTSDGANTRSKLRGRISYVMDNLGSAYS